MPQKRSTRLAPLLKIAQMKSDEGARAVAFMQTKLQEEHDKLRQLEDCLNEHRISSKTTLKQSVTADSLRSLQQFVRNVELAIEQQLAQISAVENQLGQVRMQWHTLDARSQSLQKTHVRFVEHERFQQNKIEQKELDERVSARGANRRSF